MTGIKLASTGCFLAVADAIDPMLNLPYEKFGAYALAAFCVWQMWQMIQRNEKRFADKDNQINRMLTIMESKPCLHGQIPAEKPR